MSSEKKINDVVVYWNEATHQWRVESSSGAFIQEFYGCDNFPRFFPHPNKETRNLYRVIIEKVVDIEPPNRSWI